MAIPSFVWLSQLRTFPVQREKPFILNGGLITFFTKLIFYLHLVWFNSWEGWYLWISATMYWRIKQFRGCVTRRKELIGSMVNFSITSPFPRVHLLSCINQSVVSNFCIILRCVFMIHMLICWLLFYECRLDTVNVKNFHPFGNILHIFLVNPGLYS